MGTYTDTNPTPLDNTGWTTSFFDGFNGSSLDHGKWSSVYDGSIYWNGAFAWDAGQISVGDGELTMGMTRRGDGLWDVAGLSTLSPGNDETGFDFTYGRVEIRAKVSAEITGAGPCFLLWPSSADRWPPEVDILETPKGEGMFTNHWQGPGGNNDDAYDARFFDLDSSQWHTYTLEWQPDHMTLFVDGQEVSTFWGNIPAEQMSIALQGHVGRADDGWYLSPNDSGYDHIDISVDYVRVSQYTGGNEPQPAWSEPTWSEPVSGEPAVQSPEEGASNLVAGGNGDDWLSGTEGADVLRGGDGSDDLKGGGGDDRLAGGSAHDGLTLGEGADTIVFARGDGYDWVVDFAPGTDRLELQGIDAGAVAQSEQVLWGASGLLLEMGGGDDIFLQGVSSLREGDIVFA